MNITQEQVAKMSKYLSVIHHTKGRIRIGISPQIREMKHEFEKLNISIDKAKELPKKIKGIKDFKLIALLGTVTIVYDSDIFPASMLEHLANGVNSEQVAAFINDLAREAA
jgi:hypothetical protein